MLCHIKRISAASCGFVTNSQLSAMDASVRTTMKGAAKCDKHCKLQDSANQQNFERILRFRDMPGSMPTSESPCIHVLQHFSGSAGSASLCISASLGAANALSSLVWFRVRNTSTGHPTSTRFFPRGAVMRPLRGGFYPRARHEVRSENPLNLSI